jgi:hypothetical protein
MAGYPDKALSAIAGRVTPIHHGGTEKNPRNVTSH